MKDVVDLTHPDKATVSQLQELCSELYNRYKVSLQLVQEKTFVSPRTAKNQETYDSNKTNQSISKGVETNLDECRYYCTFIEDILCTSLIELGNRLSGADNELHGSIIKQINNSCKNMKDVVDNLNDQTDTMSSTLTEKIIQIKKGFNDDEEIDELDDLSNEEDDSTSSVVEIPDGEVPKYDFLTRRTNYQTVIEDLVEQLNEGKEVVVLFWTQ